MKRQNYSHPTQIAISIVFYESLCDHVHLSVSTQNYTTLAFREFGNLPYRTDHKKKDKENMRPARCVTTNCLHALTTNMRSDHIPACTSPTTKHDWLLHHEHVVEATWRLRCGCLQLKVLRCSSAQRHYRIQSGIGVKLRDMSVPTAVEMFADDDELKSTMTVR